MKQVLMDIMGKTCRNAIIIRDINTPLISMDRSSRQKINKEMEVLNDTLNQRNLINIFRAFHPKTTEYTYFSSAHGMFSRVDHMLRYKTSLNKFKKIEILWSIFSEHSASFKLENNHKKNTAKHTRDGS